uniref:Integrase catalytic domain-containing protein n=1 Tax=Strigamia maritima TaxID=126957 RepID=T1IGU8_STRMM
MTQQIEETVKTCMRCQEHNRLTCKPPGSLSPRPIPVTPFSTIAIDHAGPYHPYKSCKHILVIIDFATRFIIAVPVRSLNAEITIETLEKFVFKRYGPPSIMISDSFKTILNPKEIFGVLQ